MKITKRDILFFVLGVVVMLVVETAYSWSDSKPSWMGGIAMERQSRE